MLIFGVEDVERCLTAGEVSVANVTCSKQRHILTSPKGANVNPVFALFEDDVYFLFLLQVTLRSTRSNIC